MQREWLGLARPDQDVLYAAKFAEPFARIFAELPLLGAPDGFPKPRALVSVLGFSWQPVALMAAWCKPERMLVIGSSDSLKGTVQGEGVLSIVARVAGIARDTISSVEIGDPGEEDIYRAVRDFVGRSGVSAHEIFVDPTGGKKSMSASAALAAFLVGAPLVYVDYGQYHSDNRIPVAGSEFPRLLTNPLEVFGDLELRSVVEAFNRSDFHEAERGAARLAERVYEPRQAECLESLARGYASWDSFDFGAAHQALSTAKTHIDRFAAKGHWSWANSIADIVSKNLHSLQLLKNVSERPATLLDGAPLLAWYLASARRLVKAGKSSHALLLVYATIERYVDLCLWVDFGLDDENPEYASVNELLSHPEKMERYDQAGTAFFGKSYKRRELSGPLMFSNGAQLLAALAPNRLGLSDIGALKGLAHDRNHSEFEHGFLPKILPAAKIQAHLDKAIKMIARSSGMGDKLELMVRNCDFPQLVV